MPNPGVLGVPRRWKRSAGGLLLPAAAADHDLLEVADATTGDLGRIPIVAGKLLKAKADGSGYEFVDPATGGGGGATVTVDTFANRPASPAAGDVFIPTDGAWEQVYDGAQWLTRLPMGRPLPAPPATGWSWVNQNGLTLESNYGHERLSGVVTNTSQFSWRARSTPTPPYTAIFALQWELISSGSFLNFQVAHRQSSDGRIRALGVGINNTGDMQVLLQVSDYIVHTFNAGHYNTRQYEFAGRLVRHPMYLKISDDNTNVYYQYSTDGQYWIQLYQVGRTSFLTPDQLCFGTFQGSSGTGWWVKLLGYEVS